MPPMPEPYPPSEYTYDDRYDRNLEQELFERDRKHRERLQREMYEIELEHQRDHEVGYIYTFQISLWKINKTEIRIKSHCMFQ